MPAAGLEPARGCPQQILSLPRLPFRHAGVLTNIEYISIFFLCSQAVFQIISVLFQVL